MGYLSAILALPLADTMSSATAVSQVHRVLDCVDRAEVVTPAGAAGALREVDRAIARLHAIRLRVLAAADRAEVAVDSGLTGTGAWLAAHTRTGGARAAADVALAAALDGDLSVTREALASGAVSTEHAAVIATTAARLPATLTAAERERVELALVAQARRVDPARLRKSARRALELAGRTAAQADGHEDEVLHSEEERAYACTRLTLHDNHDGTTTGRFTVPTLAGAILRKVIQQIASPRRDGHASRASAPSAGALPPAGGLASLHSKVVSALGEGVAEGALSQTTPSGTSASRLSAMAPAPKVDRSELNWSQRYGQAFVELLEHLPTDRLSGKVAATLVVTLDLERLRAGVGAAHLDTRQDLSASEARRLGCNAGILPAVLDATSLPLDLGRTERFFTEAQRVALSTTYDSCAAQGCDRPYAWSELHHEDPWHKGGRTDLHLAVPVCGFHHRHVHDNAYAHHIVTDAKGQKSVTFHRRG